MKTRTLDRIKPRRIETIFDLGTDLDILGLALAIVVGIATMQLTPPTNACLWTLKMIEFMGIGSATLAITFLLHRHIYSQRREEEKRRLIVQAKTCSKSLHEYIATEIIEEVAKPLRNWANAMRISHNYVKVSNFRHTIIFHNFPIDFIDIEITDYRLDYLVRWHEPDAIRIILDGKHKSKSNVALTKDRHHLSPLKKIRIDQKAIRRLKTNLFEYILYPAHAYAESNIS